MFETLDLVERVKREIYDAILDAAEDQTESITNEMALVGARAAIEAMRESVSPIASGAELRPPGYGESIMRDAHALVDASTSRIAALEQEVAALRGSVKVRAAERDAALDRAGNVEVQLRRSNEIIAELRSELAQRPAPAADAPKFARDWTRVPAKDNRRMGP